ncbi:MAG TPA: hypothetical protein VFE71_05710 [Bacteroidales bacterium]|nr:hypothetical protein [Bacteroidales bacterium]
MSLLQLRKEIQELKEAAKIKKVLSWDCKNLMSRYKEERARREILCKLYDITGVAYEAPEPYRLEVENQRDLSKEAREFLSLSAEKQAEAVEKYYPSEPVTEEKAEENSIRLADMINRIGGLEEVEHRLTRGCKFMGVEPLNIRLNPENSSV